jgi:hypothetical protein
MPPTTYRTVNHDALLTAVRHILEANHCHAMSLQAQAPAARSVGLIYLASRYQVVVAVRTNIVVAITAVETVESTFVRRYLAVADVAVRRDWPEHIATRLQMRHRYEGCSHRIRERLAHMPKMCYRQQWMRTVLALVDTAIAVAPCSFETVEAVPIAVIRESRAAFTEGSLLDLSQLCAGAWLVSSRDQHVRSLVGYWPAAYGRTCIETLLGLEAKAVPMVAALLVPIT